MACATVECANAVDCGLALHATRKSSTAPSASTTARARASADPLIPPMLPRSGHANASLATAANHALSRVRSAKAIALVMAFATERCVFAMLGSEVWIVLRLHSGAQATVRAMADAISATELHAASAMKGTVGRPVSLPPQPNALATARARECVQPLVVCVTQATVALDVNERLAIARVRISARATVFASTARAVAILAIPDSIACLHVVRACLATLVATLSSPTLATACVSTARVCANRSGVACGVKLTRIRI